MPFRELWRLSIICKGCRLRCRLGLPFCRGGVALTWLAVGGDGQGIELIPPGFWETGDATIDGTSRLDNIGTFAKFNNFCFGGARFLCRGSGREASSISECLREDTVAGNDREGVWGRTGWAGASGTKVGVGADAKTFVFSFRVLLGPCEDDVLSSVERFCPVAERETEELEKWRRCNTCLNVWLVRRMQVHFDLVKKLSQVSSWKQARG